MFKLKIEFVNKSWTGRVLAHLTMGEGLQWPLSAFPEEWTALLWELTHAPNTFISVVIQNEEILNGEPVAS